METKIDVDKLQEEYRKISLKRAENGAFKITDALKHCAEEVVEAAQAETAYQNAEYYSEAEDTYKKELTLELADVAYCIMSTASNNGIKFSDVLELGYEKEKARAEGKGDKI